MARMVLSNSTYLVLLGTEGLYSAIRLRNCYAISGTDVAFGTTPCGAEYQRPNQDRRPVRYYTDVAFGTALGWRRSDTRTLSCSTN
eukprot:3716919-Rhodomonas_salina.2